METKITRDEKLCGKDSKYPLVLLSEVKGRGNAKDISIKFRYKLDVREDDLYKKVNVEGVTEYLDMNPIEILNEIKATEAKKYDENGPEVCIGLDCFSLVCTTKGHFYPSKEDYLKAVERSIKFDAETDSMINLGDYLKKQFPGKELEKTVKTTYGTIIWNAY